ncbi:MAG: hypothetical protein ACT4QC_00250 [Planctomycetaceae bacterium]
MAERPKKPGGPLTELRDEAQRKARQRKPVLTASAVAILVLGSLSWFILRNPLLRSRNGKDLDAFLRANVDPQYQLVRWWEEREIPSLDEELVRNEEAVITKVKALREDRSFLTNMAVLLGFGDRFAEEEKSGQVVRHDASFEKKIREQLDLISSARPIRYCRIKYRCQTQNRPPEDRDRLYWLYDGTVHRVPQDVAERFFGHFQN